MSGTDTWPPKWPTSILFYEERDGEHWDEHHIPVVPVEIAELMASALTDILTDSENPHAIEIRASYALKKWQECLGK